MRALGRAWASQLLLLVLALVCASGRNAAASVCPSLTNQAMKVFHECGTSNPNSTEEWGHCVRCEGACKSFPSAFPQCSLSYTGLVTALGYPACANATHCAGSFVDVVQSTCAQTTGEACPVNGIPVGNGFFPWWALGLIIALGGVLVLFCSYVAFHNYRKRQKMNNKEEKKERARRRKERRQADRNARGGWGRLSLYGGGQPQLAVAVAGPVTPMSSNPSFRGPPMGPPPAGLTSHGSFRGPPPGPPPGQGLTSHGSFRGPPPGPPPSLPHTASFRGPPPGPPPSMAQHGSFRGPPPGGPPSFPPPIAVATPAPPVAVTTSALAPPGSLRANMGRQASSNQLPPPAAAPKPAAADDSDDDNAPTGNPLLDQIRAGKKLKKVETKEPAGPAGGGDAAAAKPAASSGGGGGMMAELQRRMKKVRGDDD